MHVPAQAPAVLPDETDDRPSPPERRTRRTLIIVSAVVALTVLLLGGGTYLVWDGIAEGRRKARAEEAVHTALSHWCSTEPLDKAQAGDAGDYFDEVKIRLSTDPRPTGYQVTGFTREGRRRGNSTYHAAVTLTFPGGPETRLYNVGLDEKSGKCFISTLAKEDISRTEAHARTVLRPWLDTWVAGGDMAGFKKAHPEAAAKMTVDPNWAFLSSEGKRLVHYDITTVGPAPGPSGGFQFTVTAVIEQRGSPETKILRYDVFKDRTLSEGRWTVFGK